VIGDRRIEVLEKRIHYLKTKIFNAISPDYVSYEKAELAALEWAMPILKRYTSEQKQKVVPIRAQEKK
jgi:hypothetical protein